MQYYTFELDEESNDLCTISTPFSKFKYNRLPMGLNSLTAMDGHDRSLFTYLRGTVVSCQIFIHSQSLIARWTCNDFSLPAVACNFYKACCIDDMSRGSKSYLFAQDNICQFVRCVGKLILECQVFVSCRISSRLGKKSIASSDMSCRWQR